jgi:hypothetical protein
VKNLSKSRYREPPRQRCKLSLRLRGQRFDLNYVTQELVDGYLPGVQSTWNKDELKITPANPSHANFLVLDFDPRSGISFFVRNRSDPELNAGKVAQRGKENPYNLMIIFLHREKLT